MTRVYAPPRGGFEGFEQHELEFPPESRVVPQDMPQDPFDHADEIEQQLADVLAQPSEATADTPEVEASSLEPREAYEILKSGLAVHRHRDPTNTTVYLSRPGRQASAPASHNGGSHNSVHFVNTLSNWYRT